MSPDAFEAEIRAAALARVRQLADRYARRIPSDELNKGVEIRGQRVPLWNQMKGIHKPAAFGRDGAALSVQTSLKSPYADVHDEAAGQIIYKFQGDNPGHADNVALRRAMETQQPLIYLVAVDPGVYDAIMPVFVEDEDALQLQFTLRVDLAVVPETQSDPVMLSARRAYETRAVLYRLHQYQFRRIVLAAYQKQCAICRLRHIELLDAAHILPDRDVRGEPVVSNGLGLCKIHHSAYDAFIIGIDDKAKVHVREDILREQDGPMLLHGLQNIAGEKLHLPRRTEHKPNPEFLAERFERFRAA